MISDIRYWEKKASERHYAIPHFNVWNAEMLMGVIDAAEELRAPIIISFGTGFTSLPACPPLKCCIRCEEIVGHSTSTPSRWRQSLVQGRRR